MIIRLENREFFVIVVGLTPKQFNRLSSEIAKCNTTNVEIEPMSLERFLRLPRTNKVVIFTDKVSHKHTNHARCVAPKHHFFLKTCNVKTISNFIIDIAGNGRKAA